MDTKESKSILPIIQFSLFAWASEPGLWLVMNQQIQWRSTRLQQTFLSMPRYKISLLIGSDFILYLNTKPPSTRSKESKWISLYGRILSVRLLTIFQDISCPDIDNPEFYGAKEEEIYFCKWKDQSEEPCKHCDCLFLIPWLLYRNCNPMWNSDITFGVRILVSVMQSCAFWK